MDCDSMHIALLIDCENASAESIHGILGELAGKGTINIRRAYGNWKNQPGWEAKLHPFAIQPVQQFAYTKGKNAVDMTMAIDAMDLLHTEQVDAFALVTSDSDFTPLVIRLLGKGKQVFGFGESKTPEAFRKACSLFIHTDGFREPSTDNPATAPMQRRTRGELRGDTELMNALRSAVDSMADDSGWANLARIGHHITNDAKLATRNYGFAKWSDLIRTTEYFEESVRDGHHWYFRRKNGNKSPDAPSTPAG
jgi:uncharacterized protein (TIGR00288 family)